MLAPRTPEGLAKKGILSGAVRIFRRGKNTIVHGPGALRGMLPRYRFEKAPQASRTAQALIRANRWQKDAPSQKENDNLSMT